MAHVKRIFACILGLLLSLGAEAQTYRYATSFSLSARDFCDTIPIEVVDDYIIVGIRMQGRTLRAMIDTGSAQGMVYSNRMPPAWTELGNVISHDANNHADTVKVVQLPPFRLGSETISGYVATVMGPTSTATKWDLVIGFDLFNKGLCGKIDTENRRMILTDRRKLFDAEAGHTLRYKLKWFVPHVMVSPFVRHTDEVLFDTGATMLYEMNKMSFDEHAYKSHNVESQVEERAHGSAAIAGHSVEEEAEVVLLHMERLEWNGFEMRDVRALTTQGSSRIGSALLRYGTVTINPFKKRLTLQPYCQCDSVYVGNKMFGTAFIPVNGLPAVGLVFTSSDAYRQGLRQGDIIQRIDGVVMRTFQDFVRFPFVKGRRHVFTVVGKDGQQREVEVER